MIDPDGQRWNRMRYLGDAARTSVRRNSVRRQSAAAEWNMDFHPPSVENQDRKGHLFEEQLPFLFLHHFLHWGWLLVQEIYFDIRLSLSRLPFSDCLCKAILTCQWRSSILMSGGPKADLEDGMRARNTSFVQQWLLDFISWKEV